MNNYNIKPGNAHTYASPHPCRGFVARPQTDGSALLASNRSRRGGYVAEAKSSQHSDMKLWKAMKALVYMVIEKRA